MDNREIRIAPDALNTGEGQRLGAEPLRDFLARTPRFALAFSGGCDSASLLAVAAQAGCDIRAYMVDTAFQPAFERADAEACAARWGVPLKVVEADVLAREEICANPPDRCYRCKHFIFGTIARAATEDGYDVIADGTNASDDPARRPGFRALAERGVVSPLRRAGLSKADVRAASEALGEYTASKPSFPCLAVFVPEGQSITADSLDQAARVRGL